MVGRYLLVLSVLLLMLLPLPRAAAPPRRPYAPPDVAVANAAAAGARGGVPPRPPRVRFLRPAQDAVLPVGDHRVELGWDDPAAAAAAARGGYIVRVTMRARSTYTVEMDPAAAAAGSRDGGRQEPLAFDVGVDTPGSYFFEAVVVRPRGGSIGGGPTARLSFEAVPGWGAYGMRNATTQTKAVENDGRPWPSASTGLPKHGRFFINDALLDYWRTLSSVTAATTGAPPPQTSRRPISVLYITDLGHVDGYKNHLLQLLTRLPHHRVRQSILDLSCDKELGKPRAFLDLLLQRGVVANHDTPTAAGAPPPPPGQVTLLDICLQVRGWPTLDAWINDLRTYLPRATDFDAPGGGVPAAMRRVLRPLFDTIAATADVLVLGNGNDRRDAYLVSLGRLADVPVLCDLGPKGPTTIPDADPAGLTVLVAQSTYVREHPNVQRYVRPKPLQGGAGVAVVTLPPMIDTASFDGGGPRGTTADVCDRVHHPGEVKPHTVTVVFVGRLVSLKGCGMFVRAAAVALRSLSVAYNTDVLLGRHDNDGGQERNVVRLKFVVIGDGSQGEDLQRLASRLGVDIEWRGFLSPASRLACALRQYTNDGGFLVYPSVYPETFGLVPVEAMRVGMPVLAFGGVPGGPNDYLRDEETAALVAAPHTPARLGDAMVQLALDKSRRNHLGPTGQAFVERAFPPQRTADRYSTLLESLQRWHLGRGRRGEAIHAYDTVSPVLTLEWPPDGAEVLAEFEIRLALGTQKMSETGSTLTTSAGAASTAVNVLLGWLGASSGWDLQRRLGHTLYACLRMSSLHFARAHPDISLGCVPVLDSATGRTRPRLNMETTPLANGGTEGGKELRVKGVPFGTHTLSATLHVEPFEHTGGSSSMLQGPSSRPLLETPADMQHGNRRIHVVAVTAKTSAAMEGAAPVMAMTRAPPDYLRCHAARRERVSRRPTSEDTNTPRVAALRTVGLANPRLTIGILVSRGGLSFARAFQSWVSSGILAQAGRGVFVFIQESPALFGSAGDSALMRVPLTAEAAAADARLTAAWEAARTAGLKVTLLGSPEQLGIGPALARLVDVASAEGDGAFMFLEEDFRVDGGGDVESSSVSSSSTTDVFHAARISDAVSLVLDTPRPPKNQAQDHTTSSHPQYTVDLVKLRSRARPGYPNCADHWRGREDEMHWVTSSDIARHKVLEAAGWLGETSKTAGLDIFPEGVLWPCGGGTTERPWTCAFSTHAGWSNNPFVARLGWLRQVIVPTANADWTRRIEGAVNLNVRLWDGGCHVVAAGEGVFTHEDAEKEKAEQSPCEKPRVSSSSS